MKFQKSLQIFFCVVLIGQDLCPPTVPVPALSETDLLTFNPMNDEYAVAAIYAGLVPAIHPLDQEQVSCNVYASGFIIPSFAIVPSFVMLGCGVFAIILGVGAGAAGIPLTIIGGIAAAFGGFCFFGTLWKDSSEAWTNDLYDSRKIIAEGKMRLSNETKTRMMTQFILRDKSGAIADIKKIKELVEGEQEQAKSVELYRLLDLCNLPYFPSEQDFSAPQDQITKELTAEEYAQLPDGYVQGGTARLFGGETKTTYAEKLKTRPRVQGKIDLDKFEAFARNLLNEAGISDVEKFNRALQLHHWAVLEITDQNKPEMLKIIDMITTEVPEVKEYILITAKLVKNYSEMLRQATKNNTYNLESLHLKMKKKQSALFGPIIPFGQTPEELTQEVSWLSNKNIPDAKKNLMLFLAVDGPTAETKPAEYTESLWKFCDRAIMEVVCGRGQAGLKDEYSQLIADDSLGKDCDWYNQYYVYLQKEGYKPKVGKFLDDLDVKLKQTLALEAVKVADPSNLSADEKTQINKADKNNFLRQKQARWLMRIISTCSRYFDTNDTFHISVATRFGTSLPLGTKAYFLISDYIISYVLFYADKLFVISSDVCQTYYNYRTWLDFFSSKNPFLK